MAEGGGGRWRGERGRQGGRGRYGRPQDRGWDAEPNEHGGRHGGGRGGRHDGSGGRGRGGRGGQGRGSGGHPTGMRFIEDDELQTLAQGSNADELIVTINNDEAKFLNTFKYQHYCKHPLKLKRLIKLLYLLVKYEDDPTISSKMLAQVLCANGDYAFFMTRVDKLLKEMSLEAREYIRRENPRYIGYLIDIGLIAIKKIPTTVVTTYPVAVIEQTIKELVESGEDMSLLSVKMEELSAEFRRVKLAAVKEKMKKLKQPKAEPEDAPPEPFTDLSVLPVGEEMRKSSKDIFLRSNKVKGHYNNWEHYFDVQFRLLREDFIRPLRNGIDDYCMKGPSHRPSDIRVYNGAKILNPVCLFTGIAFQVRFDVSKLGRVNWEHSRRLIFGSLLCLSNDKFDRCFLFASVVKRDDKLLKEGLITIKFEDNANGFRIDPNEEYTMVESTAYYEAYRHILEGLQELSRTPDVMPMKKCIVDVKFDEVDVPGFLRLPTHPPHFNMADVLMKEGQRHLVRRAFDITNHNLWPQPNCTGLDEAQLRALEMALTKEVSVIQGPPGTGKTYIGHKIVEAYLKNRVVWDPQKTAPILVVCYTNHALDQFLEGIQKLSIEEGKSPNIIRVGGRCKNESLANCVLSRKVQECRSSRSIPRQTFREFMEARTAIFDGQSDINNNMESCDAESQQKIIRLVKLEQAIKPLHVTQLLFGAETISGKEIEVWLGLWFPESQEEDAQSPVRAEDLQQQQLQAVAPPNEDASSSDEDDLIQVDNEARILEEGRIIEGEALELPERQQRRPSREEAKPTRSKKIAADTGGWQTVQLSDGERKKQIKNGFKNQPMTAREVSQVGDIWQLSSRQRWRLYLHWTNEYIKICKDRVHRKANAYNTLCTMYRQCQQNINCFAANGADVVGMTTTGAAKYHHLLKSIHPKIVIFEEAAEVLEAHVITSLAPSVQQLILIGDHKQLKPKPTCYDLERHYNLDISLFERLIKNGFEHVTLEKQHRMRPEISKLIHPTIYPTLQDAEAVKRYDHIKGVSKDLFFIDHHFPEEPNDNNDTRSHVNKYEAEYIVELCHYLCKQGYSPEDITILTMYRGQLFELRKRMRREFFEGVRVTAVDDFQGEENEIILLSLVRSNSDNSIGFLKIENRVCVSLSRAKQGLYVIGNMSMLCDQHDTKWPLIIHHLQKEQCIGSALPLYCQVHEGDKFSARTPEDFRKRPEGGCTKVCGTRLPCGHACERICHPTDREHRQTKCSKVCNKNLVCGHSCKKRCFQCMKTGHCAPCSMHVEKVLPSCGHRVEISCSANPALTLCPKPCSKSLSCGHQCPNTCSVPCSFRCLVKITKTLPCGHTTTVCCSDDPASVVCPNKCNKQLECGDKCSGTCGKCQLGRLHVKCREKCGRDLVCGHLCKHPCASICPPCEEKCNNYCFHSRCTKKCYETCVPCMEPCEWRCPHLKCTKPCGQLCNRPPCNRPCSKLLPCGHQCIGLCGEKCPKKCRVCDKDEVCEIFFGSEDEENALFIELQDCGHIFEVGGLDQWIETDTSSADSSASGSQVQFKACPKCKTFIRKSLRYGNIIKEVLKDVEAIKLKQIETSTNLHLKYKEVKQEIQGIGDTSYVTSELQSIKERLSTHPQLTSNWYRSKATEFQLSALPELLRVNKILDKLGPSVSTSDCTPDYLRASLTTLKHFLMQELLSSQQINDSVSELRRLTCTTRLLELLQKMQPRGSEVSSYDRNSIVRQLDAVYLSGWKRAAVTEAEKMDINALIRRMSNKYQVDGLSKEEMTKIVTAVGLSKGHWFKCPKGHYYCIGECGGAMQEGQCPECGSTIGGRNHSLATGNVHAGDIDGSRHAAWSDGANLANFDPADLARLRL